MKTEYQFKKLGGLSKELESVSFQALQDEQYQTTDLTEWSINVNNWVSHNKTENHQDGTYNQFTSFQKSMKYLIALSQLIGLNPVLNILNTDVSKIRFSYYSWKFVLAIILGTLLLIITMLCTTRMLTTSVTISVLGFQAFYLVATTTTICFIRIATKWPKLMKEIRYSQLSAYIDPKLTFKCNLACLIFMAAATGEHGLSILSRVVKIYECEPEVTEVFDEYLSGLSPWLADFNLQSTRVFGLFMLFMNLIATYNWSYSDLFIVCISFYLTSILKEINKKIVKASNKTILPSAAWSSLREDYTQATRLVRSFDDVFSPIVLISLANNLFFICLQLFNILVIGVNKREEIAKICPNFSCGLLNGYEYPVYLGYSTIYLVIRFLAVALAASSVHTASLEPANAMYKIPTCAYSKEVQRFLEQIHGSVVALSGLQFFYITRELVLSVAGTVITYELVLLQFNDDEIK